MKKTPVFGRADGEDPARSGSGAGGQCGQEAWRECRDDLRLAQALRQLEALDVKRLRQLEQENNRLKRLVAERDLGIQILKEVAAKKW